jgi:hypothetical protein
MLIAYSLGKKIAPHAVREKKTILEDFQQFIRAQGIATQWPEEISNHS